MKSFNVFNNRVSWTAPYHVNLPLIRAAMHLNISTHLNVKALRDGSCFLYVEWSILENLLCALRKSNEHQYNGMCVETMCVSFSISTDCSEFSQCLIQSPRLNTFPSPTVNRFNFLFIFNRRKKNEEEPTNERNPPTKYPVRKREISKIHCTNGCHVQCEREKRNWKWKIVRSMDSGKSRSCRQSRARHE